MRILELSVIGLCALTLGGCAGDQAADPEKCNQVISNVSYSADVVPIMTTYCTDPSFGDCHYSGNDAPYDFTIYDNIKAEVDLGTGNQGFYDRVLGPNADMPWFLTTGPTQLEPCDLEKLRVWVEEGAKDN